MLLFKEWLFIFILTIYTEYPFGKLIFDNSNGFHRILLPFEYETKIIRYEIKESKIDGDRYTFFSIYINRETRLIRNTLLINIDFIDKDINKHYKLSIFTDQNEEYHFKPFVFDKRENNFIPVKLHKDKKFYIEYAPQICLGLVIGGIAGAIFYIF